MTNSDSAIHIEHLAKIFSLGFVHKKIRAVTDVSLDVVRGEIFGLLGPNGAGKTTTLKILLGLLRPSAGRLTLLGEPVGNVAVKSRIGYLPESPYFYDYLTGRELLLFMGGLFDIDRATLRRRADELIEDVGLREAGNRPLRRYSKGMLQRIGLAQALINDPELVILDEPMSGLDPLGRKHVRELIAGLRDKGKTVVFSSHILSDVELLADRVAIIVNGRTVDTGRLDQLVNAKVINTEVVAKNVNDDLLGALTQAGYRAHKSGEAVVVVTAADQPADAVIDLVRSRGATVVSVTPRKESLEDVVVGRALAAGAEQSALER